MKSLSVFVGICAWSSLTLAQQTVEPGTVYPRTKIEELELRYGGVIVKGFSEIGKVTPEAAGSAGPLFIAARELIDAQVGTRDYGITLRIPGASEREPGVRAFVDYDEIDALVRGLEYLGDSTKSITRLDGYEATYRTRGNIEFTVSNNRSEIRIWLEAGDATRARLYLTFQDLARIKNLVVKAKDKLDSIRR